MKANAWGVIVVVSTAFSACSWVVQKGETKTVVVRQSINELELEPVPGTVNDTWVEPWSILFGCLDALKAIITARGILLL